MSAFVIVDLTVKDPTALQDYGSKAPDTVAQFGGKAIAKGETTALHGAAEFERKVVFEFPDKDAAMSWYASDSYQSLIEIRDVAIESQFHLVG